MTGLPDLRAWSTRVIEGIHAWESGHGATHPHPTLEAPEGRVEQVLDDLVERLHDNYPFFHPRYAGQMLKPPHAVAVAAYLAAMQINPNAHALDGGRATARLERDVVSQLAGMFGYTDHLGHLTSSGTIANLEALYVAREIHPTRAVAYSTEAHYTHGRMCGLLGLVGISVRVGSDGRMDLDALRDALRDGQVGTVVATAGTTGLGAVDPVHDIVELAREYGVRVHVDAAYGGFYTLLARTQPPLVAPAPWLAIAEADSVVVDPHKHGLQPYGCGAVMFKDPSVGRYYLHDSPYTYFTSDELHLGEISLECSRAGAAAAALWATLQLFPLEPDRGLGPALASCRRAATTWEHAVAHSSVVRSYQTAEIDIVTYFDGRARTTSEVDASSARALSVGMSSPDPVYLSTLTVASADFARRHPGVTVDSDSVRVLRSVLMKPEHEPAVPWLVERVTALLSDDAAESPRVTN